LQNIEKYIENETNV